ncbi:MAG: AIR synthase-related protein [Eubacteriales bacterium]|nr:AIR synthase-related protein [Eubacteriales bacterium]
MKRGNVSGNVYVRSVRRRLEEKGNQIQENGGEFVQGAVSGEDCAFFAPSGSLSERGVILAQGAEYDGEEAFLAALAVHSAVNRAAAARAERPGRPGEDGRFSCVASLRLLLPADAQESRLRALTEAAKEAAGQAGVMIGDVKASVTAAVNVPVAAAQAAAGCGPCPEAACGTPGPGWQIVMTKWAALEGTVCLAGRYRERLEKRYPARMLEEAAGFAQLLSVVPEAAAAGKSGAVLACAAGEGGVFAALWTLAQRAGTGLEVSLKKIPIRQETVEICNLLDVNPYELAGNGSLLLAAERGEELAERLVREGIPAAVIGHLTGDNDRVIINGEERRFLEPAREDALYAVR